jgi:hypothetical protein
VDRHVPPDLMTSEVWDRIEAFHKEKGYEKFGPYWIQMKKCLKTKPCKHHVIYEDGSFRTHSSQTIYSMLKDIGMSHSHFDRYRPK